MAKTLFTVRIGDDERAEIERAAELLGVSMSEAIRQAVAALTERLEAEAEQVSEHDADFVKSQPEWRQYVPLVVSGAMPYAEAAATAGQVIADRMKREAQAMRQEIVA